MAVSADVRDILELESGSTAHEFVTKESLMSEGKKV